MSKVSNVLLLLQYLQNGRKYSISELSEKLEVSPRMIRVYKEELEKAGIYVDTIMGPYGGYLLKQDVMIPNALFSEDDYHYLKSLSISDERYSSILDKVKRNTSLESIEIPDELKNTYNLLSRAIKENRKVKILYESYSDGVFERVIHPFHLFHYSNGWGCAAYCEVRKDLRHFEFFRMKNVQLLDDFF